MAFDFRNGFGIGLIHFIGFGFVLFLFALDVRGADFSVIEKEIADFFAGGGIVGNHFRNDVLRAGNRLLRGRNFFRYVFLRFLLDVERFILRENRVRERLQALRYGDGSPRLALLFIRAVNVLHFGERDRLFERGTNFVRHLSLFLYGGRNFLFPLFQVAKIREAIVKFPKNLIVAASRHLLSVTGDEGNRVPLVDERNNIFRMVFGKIEFLRDRL